MFENEPLADSEDKLIERIGDCNVAVDYMDLLSHRIRCHKIEIFHYDDEVSFTPNDEEEEQELSYGDLCSVDHTDDEDRVMQLLHTLDCLIRRIEQMQLLIRERQQERVERVESDVTEASTEQLKTEQHEQQLMSCQEQLELRDLQHDQQRLQCEINEMISNYRLLRTALNQLRGQMCAENRSCRQLDATVQQYHKWSEQVAPELPICKQRYRMLLACKLSKSEADRVIRANTVKAKARSRDFLSKCRLSFDLHEFNAEIDELLEYSNDLRHEMTRHRATSIESQRASSILRHSKVDPTNSGSKRSSSLLKREEEH